MFSLKEIPSTTSLLSTYTAVTALALLIRSVIGEIQAIASQLIPTQLQDLLLSKLGGLFSNPSQMTLLINEHEGYDINELYEASQTYLQTRIVNSMKRLDVSKAPRDNKVTVRIHEGEVVHDIHEGIQVKWQITRVESNQNHQGNAEKKGLELSFQNKCMEKVMSSYLPYVMERSKAIKEENKVLKLLSSGARGGYGEEHDGEWGSINLHHPATFDKLAMDPAVKQELIDDLDRFVRRREFYKRVGKAWKRGYLLYGPPGTGKSSLIAAMANYLKFNIYDLQLANIWDDSLLRRMLVSTRNRSIIVIEDIDCQNRQDEEHQQGTNNRITLSGLLNFIDGLWSSCGDERIIVFTTNHKDKLDPALLRPGRMDKHIHMSYCTPSGFRVLASNYLCITDHDLFDDIDGLMMEVEVTPAEVAEELMKSEDADIALEGLIKFLQEKKLRSENSNSERKETVFEEENKSIESDNEVGNKIKANQRVANRGRIKNWPRTRSIRNKYRTRTAIAR